jgi:hypothetical protein
MSWDVKVLLAGIALWLVSSVALVPSGLHQANLHLPPTGAEIAYRRAGILGLALLLAGSIGVVAAAISFCARLAPTKAWITGIAFLLPPGLISVIGRMVEVHTYTWTFVLLPWVVALFSGILLLLAGTLRLAVSRLRS